MIVSRSCREAAKIKSLKLRAKVELTLTPDCGSGPFSADRLPAAPILSTRCCFAKVLYLSGNIQDPAFIFQALRARNERESNGTDNMSMTPASFAGVIV